MVQLLSVRVPHVLLERFQLPVPPRVLIALLAPTKTRLVQPRVLIVPPVPPTRGFKLIPLPESVPLALLVRFRLPVPPRVLIALQAPTKIRLMQPRVLIVPLVPPTRGFKLIPLPQSVSLALLVPLQRLLVQQHVLIALLAPTKIRQAPLCV